MHDTYFSVLVIINLGILSFATFMEHNSTILPLRQKKGFLLISLLSGLATIFDYYSYLADGNLSFPIWTHYISTYSSFVTAIMIPVVAGALFGTKKVWQSVFHFELGVCFVMLASLPFRGLFYITSDGIYHRGPLYIIYILGYSLSMGYMLYVTMLLRSRYQNRNKGAIVMIIGFLLLTASFQVIVPQVRITTICITLVTLMYYCYFNDLWHQVDQLTELLSRNTFDSDLQKLTEKTLIIFLDADNFKEINDQYGHVAGDEVLEIIGKDIYTVFSHYGTCYRIGGDEFCVLLRKNIEDIQVLEKRFYLQLGSHHNHLVPIPNVSIGTALYDVGTDVMDSLKQADESMYTHKKQNKAKSSVKQNARSS